MRSFTIHSGKVKVELVTGLKWHPLIPDNFKQELVPLGVSMGADLYVYRRSDKSIVAMASTSDGYKVGQVPFALLVSESLNADASPQNAIIAVRIDAQQDIFALVLIRDGFILAKSDITGTEDDIRGQYSGFLSLFDDWDVLVAPNAWNVRGARERTVESFLPSNGKKAKIPNSWRLKPIKISFAKTFIKLAIVALLGMGGVYGYKLWSQLEAQKLEQQASAQQAALIEAQRQERLNAEPWAKMPKATQFAKACNDAIGKIGLVTTSWSLREFGCEGGNAFVVWERANKYAQISHMRAIHPSVTVSPDGVTAKVSTALNMKVEPVQKKGEQLPAAQARSERLRDIASMSGFALTIKPAKSEAAPQPGAPAEMPTPWTEVEIKAEGQLAMSDLAQLIDSPGFRLKTITGKYVNGKIEYQLVGSQYAKN